MTVFMFPGQGSQKRGMGQGLFDEVKEFTSIESQIDELLGYSLRQLCLEDTQSQLKETQYTQPCLFVVNALHGYKALADGAKPQFVAGHSLGEYNALLAAGAFDLLTGVRLVKRRGELMAQARNGGMGAVIGLAPERIADVLQQQGLSTIDVANFNAPTQTVISGPVDDIKRAGPPLQAAGATMFVPLQVSAAFHSRYMVAAAQAFDDFLGEFKFSPLQLPVIANVTGRPYPADNPSATVRSLLVKQMSQSVRWSQSIRYLLDQGEAEFREMGPGTVLTKLVQQIRQAA
jgi:malonyl CoA-acyl carrier protein transacylase